jgi:hypothetical protein
VEMNFVAIADETIAFWRDHKITPCDAWFALTGERRNYVNWSMVEEFMIGWQQGEQQRAKPKPIRKVA